MQSKRLVIVALAAGSTLGPACSDAPDDLLHPAIPRFVSTGPTDALRFDAGASIQAQCPCAFWSCSPAVCGYDTAIGGGCCVECAYDNGYPPTPQPSCDDPSGGGGDENPCDCYVPVGYYCDAACAYCCHLR